MHQVVYGLGCSQLEEMADLFQMCYGNNKLLRRKEKSWDWWDFHETTPSKIHDRITLI